MKKLMLIVACAGFLTATSYAQTAATNNAPAKSTKTSAKYYCPKCMASSDKPGKCSMCKVNMVKEGDYYCPGCYATSSKPGKCTKCNMDMKKMTASAATTK